MDNHVGKYFESPLLKGELFVAFLVPGVFYTYTEEDKIVALPDAVIETTHIIRQKLTYILGLSE
jgi:hypothetical protein